jgi:hypothetical protein
MKAFAISALASLTLAVGLGSGQASAQYYPLYPQNAFGGQSPTGSLARPPFSPYLNLTRGGNPALNYYGLVRPQEAFQAGFQQLQQQNALLGQGYTNLAAYQNQPIITGQRSTFMNYSRYFLNYQNVPTTRQLGMRPGATAGAGGAAGMGGGTGQSGLSTYQRAPNQPTATH